ncbi:MAG: DNA polymerase IV [Candidatus Magasanikbacteria bacterium]|nr:DNA polymerase IV [Candidatus Magasanikbacteria bacterium]USN52559.1 MAG: DNA polymerase IV [Candidatus Nomurabacteria bacterium]
MERIIAHIDMNSYFASVEQQANPLLRGKALGVCAYLHEQGCIIAASIEAKRQGMKVGMTLKEAREVVPGAKFIQNDPTKYRSVTKRIFAIFRQVTDKMEPYSIDEAFLDMTGWCRDEAEAAFLLTQIKERIREEIGEWLPCSIGIASTKFLAKVASERQKPNGLTVIRFHELDTFYATLDLEDFPGIGKRMRRQLWRLGIFTPLQLRYADPMIFLRSLGKTGYTLWASLNGIECSALFTSPETPKSIGHSYCVPNRVNVDGQVASTLARLVARAGNRLREKELVAHAFSIIVGVHNEELYRHHQKKLIPETDDVLVLQAQASELLVLLWRGERVTFLAVTLTDLRRPSEQFVLPMLHEHRSASSLIDWRDVSTGLDRVRMRYGEEVLFLGREWAALQDKQAPDRIGFRKIEGPGYDIA